MLAWATRWIASQVLGAAGLSSTFSSTLAGCTAWGRLWDRPKCFLHRSTRNWWMALLTAWSFWQSSGTVMGVLSRTMTASSESRSPSRLLPRWITHGV
ncbi:hypothetical protein D3C84_977890 [compost metagenome]